MRQALELETGVPLERAQSLRKAFARSACAGGHATPIALREMLSRVAVATSPNFKDVLRARVLASGEPYARFLRAYRVLVHDHALPRLAALLGEQDFAVQREPSLRFALPDCSALGARPGDEDECIGLHTDAHYDHQGGEMNVMLALSAVSGSNGVFVESEPGLSDFTAVELAPGSLFTFHGVSCRHHNQKNRTGLARVSIDFRFVPMSRYEHARDLEGRKCNRRGRFTIGEYFERVHVDLPLLPVEPLPPPAVRSRA